MAHATLDRARVMALSTPEAVQAWLCALPYNWERREKTCRSLAGVLRHNRAHCLEAALSAAVILEQHGYPPLLLDVESVDDLDHVVFLFQRDGKWGSVGRSRCYGLHGRKPVFDSPADVARSYMAPFVDQTGRVNKYGVFDLRDLPTTRWRTDAGNLWHIQEALIAMRHTRLAMPEAEYRHWKRQFDAWWEDNGRPAHAWPGNGHYPQRGWMKVNPSR